MKTRMPKFGAVPIALFQEEGLTLADVRVYAVLAMFQGHNEESYPSRETIAQKANISVESVSRAISHLVEIGWAERDQRGFGKSNIYRVMVETEEDRNATGDISRNATDTPSEMPSVTLPSIEQKNHFKDMVEKVLAYLNDKAGKRYKTNLPRQKLIGARIKEGYTIEDFKTVVDTKVSKWKDDPKMNAFLTPETLFAPSHFDNYLNEGNPNSTPLFPEEGKTAMSAMDERMLRLAKK